MPNLIRTQTVLVWAESETETAMFVTEPAGGSERRTTLFLDPDVYEDMGSPARITVTVEPGYLLNVGATTHDHAGSGTHTHHADGSHAGQGEPHDHDGG